ncbi:hypothetical protein KCP69_24405 [Salmonella enterica subsp. enterica]|nr:hypothetical protein KCP69_24405 [Salmonella enterica subsp. enterica]
MMPITTTDKQKPRWLLFHCSLLELAGATVANEERAGERQKIKREGGFLKIFGLRYMTRQRYCEALREYFYRIMTRIYDR